MRDKVRRDLLATYVKYGIEDDEDLDFCIEEFIGVTVPKKAYCSNHVSPFSFLADVFFQRSLFTLAFGSRGSGKTFLIEVHNWLKMMFTQTPIEALVAAAALDQANRGYNYFTGFFRNEPILTKYLAGDPQKALTRLTNGSSLQIVYGTKKGLNGPHTQLVSIDEVELIDYPVLEQGLAISMSKGKVAAQDILSSTRKTSVGTMSRLLEEAEEKNLAISNFCIWESVEKCTRLCFDDPVHGNCPIEDKCRGRAHDCEGWYKIDDFIGKARNLSKAMFSTEFENNDPSGETKVYGETYDEARHVISMLDGGRFKTFQQIFQLKEIPRNWRRVGGMDFGAHFAYVQFAIEPRYDIWILEREYYFHGDRLLARHAKEVLEIQAEAWKVSIEHAKRRKMFIFSDPSAKQEILEMRVYKLNCVNALNDLATGVDEVKKRLDISPINNLPKLLILDHCIETRREFRTWSHPTMPDGKPDLDAYEDGNDHCFVAGTLVETDRGCVKIEDLKSTDLILTRDGYFPILGFWKTENVNVARVDFNDGSSLIGTLNHPIFVDGFGWKRLDTLRYGDIMVQSTLFKELVPRQNLSLLSIEELSLGVTQTQKISQIEIITDRILAILEMVYSRCIVKNGLIGMVQYLQDLIFIIKMEILTIIKSRILNVCQKKIIISTMLRACLRNGLNFYGIIRLRLGHLRRNGILPKRVVHGILSMLRLYGKTLSPWLKFANTVRVSMLPMDRQVSTDSALMPVSLQQDELAVLMMKSVLAYGVEKNTCVINMQNVLSAQKNVVGVTRLIGKQDVYNLTVDGTPEYFANGVLVHNCLDSARYGIFTFPRMPRAHVKPVTVSGI